MSGSRGIWLFMGARTRRSIVLIWSALFVFSLLLQYASLASPAKTLANTAGDKTLGGFEIDGNLFSGNSNSTHGDDWAAGSTGNGLLTAPTIVDPVGNVDTTNFSVGSKEDDAPSSWQGGTGTASPKDDMGNIYVGSQLQPLPPGANSHLWTFLGVERASNNGTTFFDFEFNQKPNVTNSHGISVPNRTAGDILVVAQQQGTSSFVISATIQQWTGSAWGAAVPAPAGAFYGLSNDAAIPAGPWTDSIASGGLIPQSQFAEMAFDLTAFNVVLSCPSSGFGEVNVRTRSSIVSSAALKDYASAPVSIPPNCASLSWQKQDDSGHALGGATFTVTPNPFTGTGAGVDILDNSSADQNKADGFFKLADVVPGTYTVVEKTAPAGYIKDSTSKSITLTVFQDGSISYIWKNTPIAHPTLTTTLSGTTLSGGTSTLNVSLDSGPVTFTDSAAFGSTNANHLPTGDVTYKLFTAAASCTGTPLDTDTVTIANGLIPDSKQFSITAPGAYNVVAAYGGDTYNAAVTSACGDETVNLSKATPTLATTASGTVVVGGTINDTATVTGGFNPTGTVTFNLYGPNDATCATSIATFSDVALVAGSATSPDFTTLSAGTYRWIAHYSGDANNGKVDGSCNDANESVVVSKATPALATTASGSVVVGNTISDVATVSGGYNPTGTVTFDLYGPNDATCATSIATFGPFALAAGQASSGGFTAVTAGTYRWIAHYSGDANNVKLDGSCGDSGESVVVTKASPTIRTLATEGGVQGDPINDTATLTGAFNPTGSVTFNLYGSGDASCTADPIFTSTVAIALDGTATSGSFTAPSAGTYHWIASYSGDANNDPISGTCGDTGETTTISQFAPSISTSLSSGNVDAAKITVLFGSSVTDQATLSSAGPTAGGTVTYTVFSDSSCTTVFADAGTKAVTNGSVGASNAIVFPLAGTYYWQAHYSGDTSNAPATSVCTDEVVTVTTPIIHAEKLVKVNSGAFSHSDAANPGDTLTYQITVTNSGDAAATAVPVEDDITSILAHATLNSCTPSCLNAAGVLSWTIASIPAAGQAVVTFSVTLDSTFPTGATTLPNIVVVTGPGSNCLAVEPSAECRTITTVNQAQLTLTKSVAGNTGGTDAILHLPVAKEGDTLTYTLAYTLVHGPVTNGVLTDVIPAGLDYQAGTATNNAEFQFVSYTAATRTLRWEAATVTASGSVTYKVTVASGAADLAQPLTNVATIASDQTAPSSARQQVLVAPPPLAATGTPKITLPPTDTLDTTQQSASNPGFALMVALLALAGLAFGIGYVTPVPERVRRRNGRS